MITVEEFLKTVAGDTEEPTETQRKLAQSLFDMYDKDVQGLKVTNAQLKEEKTKEVEKYRAEKAKLEEASKSFEEQLKAAQEQIAKNNPDEAKQYYDTQLANIEASYKSQIADREKTLNEKLELIKQYERKDLLRSQEVEFDREIRKTSADPKTYDWIKTLVLGDNGDRFMPHETSEGTMFWATDNSGETISNRIDKILNSDAGKRFCTFNSSGAGAEGGFKGGSTGPNPFKTGDITAQMELYRKDPEKYRQMQAVASMETAAKA